MTRLIEAWRALAHEQRRAALAAIGLFVTMFLPWYSKTDTFVVKGAVKSSQSSLNAFQALSFVEAAVLLVSAGVLTMLFARAEGRHFQLPGGDGLIVTLAGGWTALLIFYRLLDKPGLHGNEKITATVGVEWGIFIALLVALVLTYAGWRMRHGERPETPARRPPQDPPGERPRGDRDPAREELRQEGRRREAAGSAGRPRASAPGPDPPVTVRETDETAVIPAGSRARAVPARPQPARPRYPPRPVEPEQLSFEQDPPGEA